MAAGRSTTWSISRRARLPVSWPGRNTTLRSATESTCPPCRCPRCSRLLRRLTAGATARTTPGRDNPVAPPAPLTSARRSNESETRKRQMTKSMKHQLTVSGALGILASALICAQRSVDAQTGAADAGGDQYRESRRADRETAQPYSLLQRSRHGICAARPRNLRRKFLREGGRNAAAGSQNRAG